MVVGKRVCVIVASLRVHPRTRRGSRTDEHGGPFNSDLAAGRPLQAHCWTLSSVEAELQIEQFVSSGPFGLVLLPILPLHLGRRAAS